MPPFSIGARPLYIPKGMYTSSVQRFPFLHILSNTCYSSSFVLFSFWSCWVFVAVQALSLCVNGSCSSLPCAGFSLWGTGSRCLDFSSCSTQSLVALWQVESFQDSTCESWDSTQESNLCALHWQADSHPLYHRGSPLVFLMLAILARVKWENSLAIQWLGCKTFTIVAQI